MTDAGSVFRVSAIQFQAKLYRPDDNRQTATSAIRAAADHGATLIVLPELCISGYGLQRTELAATAESVDGETIRGWQHLAAELGVTICGGFCEIAEGRLYNSAALVTPNGKVTNYRKLHLFDGEKDVFTPGDLGLPVVETPVGRVGVCVCYDLRFVEVARCIALAGADILAVPTAWIGGFDTQSQDMMGFIGQARGAAVQANLNQVAMICASQCGSRDDIRFLGSSLIVDAFGVCLAGPAAEDETAILEARLDLDEIRASRVRGANIRPREDRRTDVYDVILRSQGLSLSSGF